MLHLPGSAGLHHSLAPCAGGASLGPLWQPVAAPAERGTEAGDAEGTSGVWWKLQRSLGEPWCMTPCSVAILYRLQQSSSRSSRQSHSRRGRSMSVYTKIYMERIPWAVGFFLCLGGALCAPGRCGGSCHGGPAVHLGPQAASGLTWDSGVKGEEPKG